LLLFCFFVKKRIKIIFFFSDLLSSEYNSKANLLLAFTISWIPCGVEPTSFNFRVVLVHKEKETILL